MALNIGTQLGSYEITALLGKGGMGEVYRARDPKLKREVAIKVLPEEVSHDADRVSRFQREAEVLASLNHPNIAQIYGLENSTVQTCIVMELVEGETLADRLKRGPIPVDEALQIAKQIVDALEAAHERGIVHRDLKPANIKQAPTAAVKILDFGLARATRNPFPSEQGSSNSPTLLSGSLAGVILGTAPYMSPEQARGKDVDVRTDIWAFGCVLYELLTGKQAFSGDTNTDILARVLEGQPKWEALPAETTPSIRILLEAALKKDPKQRLRDIGDARIFLAQPMTIDSSAILAARNRSGRRARMVAIALGLAFAATLVPAVRYFMRSAPELPVMRFEMPVPGFVPIGLAISPDGERVAYVASNGGASSIWVRSIGSLAAQQLPGTENASGLFWAPDSHRLGFFADAKLKKTDVLNGGVQTLADRQLIASGTWNRDGVILLPGPLTAPGIVRISDSGGETVPVTTAAGATEIQLLPEFLPDGRHFLFHSLNRDRSNNGFVYLGSLDSKSSTRLMQIPDFTPEGNDSGVAYAQGYLLFSRDRTLLAQRFDPVRGTLSGEVAAVVQNVGRAFSVSDSGVLVYRTILAQASPTAATRLSWFDRKGKPAGEIASPTSASNLALYRDGRIAVDNQAIGDRGGSDIWVIDSRGVPNKLTADNPSFDGYPVWSPDGSRIAFAANRDKNSNTTKLYQIPSNGVGNAELLMTDDADVVDIPQDWSSGAIIYDRFKVPAVLVEDLWFLSMPEKKPSLYLHNGFANSQARISPDGRYVAYATNESGSAQIVVQTFPNAGGGKWPITAHGGTEPAWRSDGRELYYLAPDGKIVAVSVKIDPTFQADQASELFQTTLLPTVNPVARRYAVSADGQRFLLASSSGGAASSDSTPITVVVNWTAALRKK
jgi:eukaryotic-like serine/threonine-protein kinase